MALKLKVIKKSYTPSLYAFTMKVGGWQSLYQTIAYTEGEAISKWYKEQLEEIPKMNSKDKEKYKEFNKLIKSREYKKGLATGISVEELLEEIEPYVMDENDTKSDRMLKKLKT